MELTEFLLARIAEDETAAKAAQRESSYQWSDNAFTEAVELAEGEGAVKEATRHIARWDPARVLAECEAKRRIVELDRAWPVLVERPAILATDDFDVARTTLRLTQQIAWTTQEEYRKRFGEEPPAGPMLRALALPYANHPDYDESWRP